MKKLILFSIISIMIVVIGVITIIRINTVSAEIPPKIIFILPISIDGDLGGVSGADTLCTIHNTHGGTAKALIGTSDRQVGGSDWVLTPNVNYFNTGADTIDATDSNGWFTFDLDYSIAGYETNQKVYTGLTETGGLSEDYNCGNWTTQNADAEVGIAGSLTSTAISKTVRNCGDEFPIYCVVQQT